MNGSNLRRYILHLFVYAFAILLFCATSVENEPTPDSYFEFEVKNESNETVYVEYCIIIDAKTDDAGRYKIPYFNTPTKLLPNQQCDFKASYWENNEDNGLLVVYQFNENTLKNYTEEEIVKNSLYDNVYTKPLKECVEAKQYFVINPFKYN